MIDHTGAEQLYTIYHLPKLHTISFYEARCRYEALHLSVQERHRGIRVAQHGCVVVWALCSVTRGVLVLSRSPLLLSTTASLPEVNNQGWGQSGSMGGTPLGEPLSVIR